jgi:two-component system NtrC family sensor kinase
MKELRQQLVSALLVIITVAAVVAAAINLQQQNKFHLPDDGVTWLDQSQGDGQNSAVVAIFVAPGSPGEKAGIHKGDRLVSIADLTIQRALDVTAVLARLGSWKKVEYQILHNGIEVPSNVIIGEAERDSTIFYQYAVGAVYLAIGLFVYFRRGSAPRALHFFILCVTSFILFTFHYSGKLNNFDKVVYLGNLVAGFHAVPAFLLRVSGAAAVDSSARCRAGAVFAGPGVAGHALGLRVWLGDHRSSDARNALAARSGVAGFPVRDVSGRRRGSDLAVAACR